VNFEFMANLSADITYKYFYSEYEIEDWDAEAKNHMFTLGVNYHF
jgi:opacity protein-like surface antigen